MQKKGSESKIMILLGIFRRGGVCVEGGGGGNESKLKKFLLDGCSVQ